MSWRLILVVPLLFACLAPLAAESDLNGSSGHGPLDGLVFKGTFGPAGKPADTVDTLRFGRGKFWSGSCVPCGFKPGNYWFRYVGTAIHFRGELISRDHGSFTYTGVVEDASVEASIQWRKERWYWTIDREFRFRGDLTERAGAQAAGAALKAAMNHNPDPERDCRP
jgi:hypothetical protein